jgi:hypothetical protein
MHVVGDASHAIAEAVSVARNGSEVRVKRRADRRLECGDSAFGAEDKVDEDEGERLRHGKRIARAFSP